MSQIQELITQTNEQQLRAADPKHDVWIMANAGAGKTTVLVKRYLHLLLQGNDVSSILCLTFTRAGASVMLERIYSETQKWLFMSDEELSKDLSKIVTAPNITEELIYRARSLFGLIIEHPTDLKVQTIHSFAEKLLRYFPLETDIPPDFTVLEESQTPILIQQVLDILAHNKEKDIQEANDLLTYYNVDRQELLFTYMQVMTSRFDSEPNAVNEFIQAYYAEKYTDFNITQSIDEYYQSSASNTLLTQISWQDVYDDLCALYPKTHEAKKILLRQFLLSKQAKEKIEILQQLFLTKDNQLAKNPLPKKILELYKLIQPVPEYILNCHLHLCAIEHYQVNSACVIVADFCLQEYKQLKTRHHYVDYNDLLSKLHFFLRRFVGIKYWIFKKIHYTISHLLIDEAQDNSTLQWEIIALLSQHFFNHSDNANPSQVKHKFHSLFVVGDKKQSIFSFQGADPEAYLQWQKIFEEKSNKAGKKFVNENFINSFRTANFLLQYVDEVFSDDKYTQMQSCHKGFNKNARIEVWPLCEAVTKEDDQSKQEKDVSSFFPESYTKENKSAEEKLAENIASIIDTWRKEGLPEPFEGKKPVLSEIMILLRKRGTAMYNINKALQEKGIAVCGMDRFSLKEDPMIQDLMALARWALYVDDDLSLAEVCKGCFVNMPEEELMLLCTKRGAKSLWEHLECIHQTEPHLRILYHYLLNVLTKISEFSVYDFYIHVLYAQTGIEKIESYFGSLSKEPLEAFLEAAYQHDQQETNGMHGFLTAIKQDRIVVKRETHAQRDAVRVLTIHGAKGQEADIVFLADTYHEDVYDKPQTVSYTEKHQDGTDKSIYAIQTMPVKQRSPLDQDIVAYTQKKTREESHRLLYVALTRARFMTIICGSKNKKTYAKSWYETIKANVHDCDSICPHEKKEKEAECVDHDKPIVKVYSCHDFENGSENSFSINPQNYREKDPRHDTMPDSSSWRQKPLQKDNTQLPLSVLSLSSLSRIEADYTSDEPSIKTSIIQSKNNPHNIQRKTMLQHYYKGISAKQKGIISHALLEYLPTIASHKYQETALLYIKHVFPDLAESAQIHMSKKINDILKHPQLYSLFQKTQGRMIFFELPIIGIKCGKNSNNQQLISARLDALVIDEKTLWVIDYKYTNNCVDKIEDVPKQYVHQMNHYGNLLHQIFPNHRKYLWLAYIESGKIIDVPFLVG